MAYQPIGIGLASNDGSGDKLRVGAAKVNNNFEELYARVQALETGAITAASIARAKLTVAATGTVGQVIAYTSQFVAACAIQIIDYNGLGIEITAQDADGFTITSGIAGNFGYIALIEV